MKEAIISKGPKVTIHDVPLPQITNPHQLLIKVAVSGSNPKDWKTPEWTGKPLNHGDDIAGIVEAVGEAVNEFKVGDRVASFHEMRSTGGSYAEYALGWDWSTFLIPKNVSFEDAATVPLAAMTAAIGIYQRLGLPEPWVKATVPTPLVIYGGASAIGAFAIQLARLSNIHPIIAVAGRGASFVESLLEHSKGDCIVDYRNGDDAVVFGIKEALKGRPLCYAFDGVSDYNSYINLSKVLHQERGNITLVILSKTYSEIPESITKSITYVGNVHNEEGKKEGTREFSYAWFRLFAKGLAEGWVKPHPYEVLAGGLAGVELGLRNLKEGKASAVKYVFRIAETPGVGNSIS